MRKLKACIHIMAPVQIVRNLADSGQRHWLVTRGSMLLRPPTHQWEAIEFEGGTRFTLHMEYKPWLPFLAPLMPSDLGQSAAYSLSRLKQMAEESLPRGC